MTISARIIADSVNPAGNRLTSVETTYPRFIHAEVMTYGMAAKNAASSRAIPIEKMLERIEADPATFVWWGKNQKGMQAREELQGAEREAAIAWWDRVAKTLVALAREGQALGLHKQVVNRVTEPVGHITTLFTATDDCWANLFFQRDDPDAQPEFQALAATVRDLYDDSVPEQLMYGGQHLPYVSKEELDRCYFGQPEIDPRAVSAARCARTSYLTQGGLRDLQEDLALFQRLVNPGPGRPGHWSPLEHPAMALESSVRCGKYRGFRSFRHSGEFPNEYHFHLPPNPRRK